MVNSWKHRSKPAESADLCVKRAGMWQNERKTFESWRFARPERGRETRRKTAFLQIPKHLQIKDNQKLSLYQSVALGTNYMFVGQQAQEHLLMWLLAGKGTTPQVSPGVHVRSEVSTVCDPGPNQQWAEFAKKNPKYHRGMSDSYNSTF